MRRIPLTQSKQVKYCSNHSIPFLAQSGGRGWSTTFNTSKDYVIIDLRSLNFVIVDGETNLAHVGGGANFGEIVDAAYENNLQMGE
jgi:FAD/FMN-containing dehydrogenase